RASATATAASHCMRHAIGPARRVRHDGVSCQGVFAALGFAVHEAGRPDRRFVKIVRGLIDRLGVVGICVAIGVVFGALRLATPWPIELLDLKALDLRFTLRGTRLPTSAVVIVGIDERSLARYGRWPWPRSLLAQLVGRLTADGAKTIAFDAVFDQPDP